MSADLEHVLCLLGGSCKLFILLAAYFLPFAFEFAGGTGSFCWFCCSFLCVVF